MIKIFVKSSSSGCRQAQEWFKEHQIPFQIVRFSNIQLPELIQILSLTDTGTSEIQAKKTTRNLDENKKVSHMIDEAHSFTEVLSLIKGYPQCFKAPIIMDEHKILVGYNDEEIRKFLPRTVKKHYRYSS